MNCFFIEGGNFGQAWKGTYSIVLPCNYGSNTDDPVLFVRRPLKLPKYTESHKHKFLFIVVMHSHWQFQFWQLCLLCRCKLIYMKNWACSSLEMAAKFHWFDSNCCYHFHWRKRIEVRQYKYSFGLTSVMAASISSISGLWPSDL